MTTEVWDWLPRQAFSSEAVTALLAGVVEEWAFCWFGDAQAIRLHVGDDDGQPLSTTWNNVNGEAAVASLDGPGKRVLLEMVFNLGLEGSSLTEPDHRLLDAFSSRLVEDLTERLDKLLGTTKAFGDREDMIGVVLSRSDCDVVHVRLPKSGLVPLLKARITASTNELPPVRRRQALDGTSIALEAVLGQASLPIDDFRGLAVGDVLVLDRLVEGPVELRLTETGQILASGRLQKTGDRIAVHI